MDLESFLSTVFKIVRALILEWTYILLNLINVRYFKLYWLNSDDHLYRSWLWHARNKSIEMPGVAHATWSWTCTGCWVDPSSWATAAELSLWRVWWSQPRGLATKCKVIVGLTTECRCWSMEPRSCWTLAFVQITVAVVQHEVTQHLEKGYFEYPRDTLFYF